MGSYSNPSVVSRFQAILAGQKADRPSDRSRRSRQFQRRLSAEQVAELVEAYEEGATHPKMMSVGLHCRIAGRPGRAWGLDRFIEYARQHSDVWFARRSEIARWWLEQSPPR